MTSMGEIGTSRPSSQAWSESQQESSGQSLRAHEIEPSISAFLILRVVVVAWRRGRGDVGDACLGLAQAHAADSPLRHA